MMDEKVITRKFHSHDTPDIFFKFDDARPIELPRRVGDFRRDQLPADGRIETESGGRSEERRVGKECRPRSTTRHEKKTTAVLRAPAYQTAAIAAPRRGRRPTARQH